MLATVEEVLTIQVFVRSSYGGVVGGVRASTAYVMRWMMV
jgi:hypothetical protein